MISHMALLKEYGFHEECGNMVIRSRTIGNVKKFLEKYKIPYKHMFEKKYNTYLVIVEL